MPVLRLNLVAGVKWLKKELSERVLFSQKWSPADRVSLWHWITLWDQLDPELRGGSWNANDSLDWNRLRQDLENLLLKEANSRANVNR